MPTATKPTVPKPPQQAFRFALDPTPAQTAQLASHAGASRYAYNWGIAQIASALDAYTEEKAAGVKKPTTSIPRHFDLCKMWTAHKNDPANNLSWVGENHANMYQAALRDSAVAWKNFFKSRKGERAGRPVGRPRFKKKGRARDSFQTHGGSLELVDGSHLKLPKIGIVKIPGMVRVGAYKDRNARTARKLYRQVSKGHARVVRATMSREADGTWWASVTAEITRPVPTKPSRRQRAGGTIGVDLGVRYLAVTSNGDAYPNERHLEAALGELAIAQRALARTQKDSKRRAKARILVGRLHAEVALRRHDATNRLTTALVRAHAKIVTEGWDAQRLAQHGSAELPRRVRRNRNRALADAAPGKIRWQLEYKSSRSGAQYVEVPKDEPTGRTCSACGRVKATPVPPASEQFTCQSCGHRLDRRLNTARVLAKHTGRDAAPGGSNSPPDKPRGGGGRPGAASRTRRPPAKRAARTRGKPQDQSGTPDP